MKYILSIAACLLICYSASAQNNTLDHYLETAHQNSPLLKDLHNQILASQLDSMKIRAQYKPQINITSNGYYAPVINGYGYAGAITNVHTFSALAGVNQAIVEPGNIRAQVQATILQAQTVGNSLKISEQDLKKTITAQYITVYGDQQQVAFNRKVIELLNQEEDALKKLTRGNVYRQSDYLTFLVTLKQQQVQLTQSLSTYKNDYATLNYLAGITDTTAKEVADPGIERMTVTPDTAHSIFFAQYRTDSLKNANALRVLNYAYHPKLNAFGDAGFNSDFTSPAYHNWGTSVGFSLVLPIYDGGVKKIEQRRIKLEEETRKGYKAFASVQIKQQVAQLNQQIDDNDKLILQIDDQIKYTEGLIKADTKLLGTGDVKIADLILAINNYLTVQNLRTQTVIAKLQLINQLNYWNK